MTHSPARAEALRGRKGAGREGGAASIPELPREQAEALLRAAHEVCPYSNATRGNIVVDLRLA